MPNRRDVLSNAVKMTAVLSIPHAAESQVLSKELRDDLARQFGMQFGVASPGALKILRKNQEERVPAPIDEQAYKRFVEQLPSIRALRIGNSELQHLLLWNEFSLMLNAQDHTVIESNSSPTYAEQFGPHRSARALAIVHIAMFEAVNSIYRRYQSHDNIQTTIFTNSGLNPQDATPQTASVRHAILSAAYGTLVALYPNKKFLIDVNRTTTFPLIGDSESQAAIGSLIGSEAAKAILARRTGDGAEFPEPPASAVASTDISKWTVDPISQVKTAIGGNWGKVRPFVIPNASAFRPPQPPAVGSPDFEIAYSDVRAKGGDSSAPIKPPRWKTEHNRTGAGAFNKDDETFVGIYWGYDGTALLCAPPRLYNMIATSIATGERPIPHVADAARFLALINTSLADAGISAWEAKYHYSYPRPITYIRRNNPQAVENGTRNEFWTPLGAPVTNGRDSERNLTPPFPSYPSGHAVFGAALFQAMRAFYEIDKITDLDKDGKPSSFSFVSDEFNGINREAGQESRPRIDTTFKNFGEAELANARSRIFLGIHWQFDATNGVEQGQKIAAFVAENAFKPL